MPKCVYYSTVWSGVRSYVHTLLHDLICIVGSGSTIDFWHDNWLGYVIVDKLRVPPHVHIRFHDKVGDFLDDAVWRFTASFVRAFPDIMADIRRVPIVSGTDKRLWSKSLHGFYSVYALGFQLADLGSLESSDHHSCLGVTMREMDFMHGKKGYMKNEIKDLMILKALNVKLRPAPLKKTLSVIWRPPPIGWIKINTDGAAQGAPGMMSTGEVFL
ncbi:Polynucleotidyl transferase [Perilla frutescens var. frutescens]|nr:Polynucleotidyl transferase [Perilla frutescens var. frutescens]